MDEKKEKMKNALFSGITAKKDSDDSDEDKQKDKAEPAGEVNLRRQQPRMPLARCLRRCSAACRSVLVQRTATVQR